MNERPFQNREITRMFGEHEALDKQRFEEAAARDADHKKLLLQIHDEVKYTNGKVAEINKWRWMQVGGLAVITTIVVPIFLNIIQKGI